MSKDNVSGIVLNIPKEVLTNIKRANDAILTLEDTSRRAAQKIEGHFGTQMPRGVEKFITAIEKAQGKLNTLKVPTIETTGLSAAVQALSQATAAIDKTSVTGARRFSKVLEALSQSQNIMPNPQVFQTIADGIGRIGNMSQQTINNVRDLGRVMAQLARDIRIVEQAQTRQSISTATAAQYNKLYKEQAQLMRDMQTLWSKKSPTAQEIDLLDKMKKRYAEIVAQIDKLDKKQQTAASNLAKTQGQMRVGLAASITSPQDAIGYAKQAKSLNELQAAYKNLKAVMATVDPKTAAWQQMNAVLGQTRNRIDEIKKKMGEFKSTASGIGGIAGQLARTLAATFSVSAITNYIEKMVQVRAQFELQQTALRAILQDKQKADQIFQQVQQMALQSPFSIMQMTTFTKQLAAYRIEADKLVGTTKMLADVSAGLGVDMQRLILAYGQVKAANYLRACLGRGTKVKMFDGTSKNVEDVVIGDVLMGDDEQPRHVSKLYRGKQQMYRISYGGGEFRCNEHHILTVYDALTMRVSDVFVLDYLKEPYRYHGVKRIGGEYKTFIMKVEPDNIDTYYGFSIDGNHRFIIEDNIVTHNTEVRQFTEAGLNIAGELATYFSELQGKMVSVGDVMRMITKRMVRFEDVEEVFKRVTSAGGLFYDMQKKQSNTLWGQLQRIKDAMSIMFNEIGKSNQGTLSWFLTTIRALISNWRILATAIKVAGGFLGFFYITSKSLAISKFTSGLIAGMRAYIASIRGATAAAGGLKAALSSLNFTGWGAIIAGIGLAVSAIIELTSNTSALKEELDRIAGESMADMYDAMYKFSELAKTATDATKSYKERAEAMESLNRAYKDILPSEMLEIDNIRQMSEGYTEATEAIRQYYMEVAKKKAQETVANEQEKAWNTLINHIKDDAAFLKDSQESLADMPIATLKGLLGKTMMELKAELESGRTEVGHAWERFKELFKETSGREIVDSFYSRGFRAYFGEYTFTITDFYDDIIDITKQGTAAQMEIEAQYAEGFSIETKDIIRQYNERKKAVSDFQRAMTTVTDLKQKGELRDEEDNLTERGVQITNELAAAKDALNQYLNLLGEAPIYWREVNVATENDTDALLYFDEIQKRVLGGFLKNVQEAGGDKSLQGWAERTERELKTAGLSDLQLDIIKLSKESATANGMQMQMLNKLKISAETNYASAAQDAKALSDQATDNVKKIQATKTALLEMARAAGKSMSDAQAQAEAEARHGNGFTEEELKAQSEFWEKLAKLYGNYERKRDNGRQKDIWAPRLNLMQKINKEYEKLLKYYSKEEAMAKIRQSYGDAVAEAFKGTQWADISKWGTFDAQATIDRLKKLAEVAGKESKKKILEAAGTLEAEIEIKVKEQEIQKAKDEVQRAFDNYELTKTLGNLGLNVDLTFMVGGRPTTLAQLRKDVEDKLQVAKATKGQEALVKVYEDYLRKITDMENKAAVERLKNYKKYLAIMYSDRAKAMIESYTTMKNMERDFADYRAKLEKEASDPATSAQRRQEISQQISMLETQARDAIKGVKDDLDTSLNKLDWEAFKGSPVFTQMYSDLETLSKKGIDLLITKLTTMRDKLQAMDNVDYRAVREITKYIEKLNTQRIEVDSWKELNAAIKEANALRKEGNNMDKAQSELMSEQANLDAANAKIANLQTIINLKQQEGTEESKIKNLSADQLKLYDLSEDKLQKMLSTAKDNANAAQAKMLKWSGIVTTLQKGKKALDEQLKRIKMLHDDFDKVYDSAIDLADALGADTEIWGDFAKGVGDSIFQVIELTIQLKIMSIAANSALGVIGYIAIALQSVASLFASIFRAGDKRKEKQIQRLQYKVEDLQKAYEKLQTAIEEAYTFDDYNAGYNQSMRNLQERRDAIQEQLALEKSKKKSDKDKIREYEDALDELVEKEKELREARYEAMGSVGESGVRTEAENFVSAWLDAYKETGDGLDALKEHWDEFFQNLVLKQAVSAVVSRRMGEYVDQINAAIDSGDTGLSLSQTFAQIGQNLKNELSVWNEDLKAFFDAVGIKGGQGELLLSDLQKGIQNITEPQAAAIEAYLNSMRFAVFEQNNILTEMLAAIQAQYAPDNGSPMLQEVRAIRSLVASIDDRLSRVIVSRNSGNSNYIVKVN